LVEISLKAKIRVKKREKSIKCSPFSWPIYDFSYSEKLRGLPQKPMGDTI